MKHKANSGVVISRKVIFLSVVVVILLLVGGIALGLNWNNWFGDNQSDFTPNIDENAADWTGEALEDKTDDSTEVGIKIPGYPSITLPADTTEVSVALLNPEDNPCYFTFSIVLQDTGEILYTSELVPPGQVITEITLSRALEQGEYDATIQITTASLEDGSAMNGANVETVLIVQ